MTCPGAGWGYLGGAFAVEVLGALGAGDVSADRALR